MDTAKQHPIATAVLGAGIAAGAAMLTARAVRNASSASSSPQGESAASSGNASRAADQSEDQADQGGADQGGDEEDEGEGSDSDDDDDEDEDEDDGSNTEVLNMRRRSRNEYDYDEGDDLRDVQDGGDSGPAGPFWKEHPLLVASALAIVGIAAGMALPVSQFERNLAESIPGDWPRRLRRSTRTFIKEGRGLATRLIDETTTAASEAAADVGLTPDKLSRKVRKVAQRVQSAASHVFTD